MKSTGLSERFILLSGLIAALLVFSILGSTLEWTEDEHYYMVGGAIMKDGGDLLVPSNYQGSPRFMKPPFYYWCEALSFRIFGENFFAARLPSFLFAAALLFFTWKFASDGGREPSRGIVTVAILAGSYLFFYYARSALTDMAITAGMAGGFWYLLEYLRQRRSLRILYLSALWFGISAMSKGPVILAIAGIALAAFMVAARREIGARLIFRPGVMGPLFLLGFLASWWYVLMAIRYWPDFMLHQVNTELVSRVQTTLLHRMQSLFWYPGRVFVQTLPWTLFLVPLALRKAAPRGPGIVRKLAYCVMATVILFYVVLIDWRTTRYMLPMIPFLALIIGDSAEGTFSSGSRDRRTGVFVAVFVSSVAVLFAVASFFLMALVRADLSSKQLVMFIGYCAGTVFLCSLLLRYRKDGRGAVVLAALLLIVVYTGTIHMFKNVLRRDYTLGLAEYSWKLESGNFITDIGMNPRDRQTLFFLGNRKNLLRSAPIGGPVLGVVAEKDMDGSRYETIRIFEQTSSRRLDVQNLKDLRTHLLEGDFLRKMPSSRIMLVRSAY